MKRLSVLLLCVVGLACQDITVRWVCRGDTFPADTDTSLVRCSTLDSLAHGDTTP